MVVNGENIRKIHKKIYEMTIKVPKMYLFMEKVANKSFKSRDKRKTQDENADLLLLLFKKFDYNGKIKKVINHDLMENAEKGKDKIINNYVNQSRDLGKYIYLASSHDDSAKDHEPWQGKLYYDEKAPDEIIEWARKKGLHSIQWVMGSPVWFITRPNCRHFFKSLPLDVCKKYGNKELIRRYKMHRKEGDRSLATPKHVAIEEYEDRLKMLEALYAKHKTERLRREIQKTKLLLKKWKNAI